MASGRQISIRLSLEEAEKVRADLRAFGAEGRNTLDTFEKGAARAAGGTDKITASVQRLTAAQQAANRFASVTLTSDDTYSRRAADIAAFGAEIDRLRAKYVPLDAAMQQSLRGIDEIRAAQKSGTLSANEAASAIETVTARYRQMSTAADEAAQAQRAAAAAQGQSAANRFAGVAGPADADAYAKRAADIAAFGAEIDRLRAKYVPLDAAMQQSLQGIDDIRDAQRAGALSTNEAAAAIENVTARYRQMTSAAEEAAQAQRAAAAAQGQSAANRFAGVAGPADGEAYAKRAADLEAFGREMDAVRAKFSPLFQAQQQYRASLADMAQAERTGALNATEHAAARERLKASFAAQVQELTGAAAAERAHAEATAKERAEVDRLTASLTGYVNAMDPIAASLARLTRAEGELAAAQARGVANGDHISAVRQMRQAHEELESGVKKAGNSFGLQRYQVQNLTAQFVDFGVQISSGGGILLPLIQQGPQAVEAVGGLGGAFRALTQLATPLNLGIAATAAVLGTAVLSAERSNRAINDLSARLRTTRSDFAELARDADVLARKLAGSTTLTTSDARAAAGTIAGSRDFSGNRAELERLTKLSADVARAFGITVPEAAQRLADGLKKPGEAARRLINEDFRGVDDALRRQIELMEAGGQKMEAQSLLNAGYARGVAGAAAAMTPFQRALEDTAQAAARLWNGTDGNSGLRVILEGIGRPIVAGAGGLISFLSSIISKLEEVRSKIEGMGWLGRLIAGDPSEAGAQANDWLRGRTYTPPGSAVTGPNDTAARILYGEANGQGEQGLAAAAAVIVNRARLTGQTPDQVVQAPGQFEPWGNAARRDRLMAMAPEQYEQASRILAGVMSGQIADPTGGATHFYAPGLQSSLGRNRPSWASGDGVTIGGHVFYSRPQDFGQGSAVPGRGGRTLAAADEGLRNWDNQDVLRERNAARIGLYEDAAATPGLSPERAKDYAERLKELRAEAERLRDPMEELRRQGEEQARVFRQASGAAQTLAEAELRGIQAARAAGEDVNGQAARGLEERAQAQGRLRSELLKAIEATERDTGVKQAQVAVVANGARAMQDAAIQRQAEVEALNFAAAGTDDYTLAVNLLVDAKRNQKAADVDLGTATLISQQVDQIALLERETQLIGLSTEARQAELAVFKERQRVKNAGGDPDSEMSRQAQDNIRQTKQIETANQQLTNSWTELTRVGEQAFDRIGASITEAFANGSLRAVDFGNIAKAAISEVAQAAARMAVVNPVLNYLDGGTRGTLGGALQVANGSNGAPAANGGGGGLVGYAQQGMQAYSTYSKLSSVNPTGYINGSTPFATGWGGLDGALNTPIWGASSGINAGGAVTNSAGYGSMAQSAIDAGGSASAGGVGGLTYGGAAAGALGIAGGLYGAYSGVKRGGVGGYTQAVGGAASAGLSAAAMAGMAVPVYGWIAAAALTIIGALLPGQKPSDRTGTALFNTLDPSNPVAGGLEGSRFSQENRDQARTIGTQLSAIAQSVGKAADLGQAVAASYQVSFGSRDGVKVGISGTKIEGAADEAGITAVTKAFAAKLLELAQEQSTDGNIRTIIGRSGNADPEATMANLEWYRTAYKGLTDTVDPSKNNSFSRALDEVTAKFGAIREKAEALGLSLDPVTAAFEKERTALDKARVTAFDSSIRGMIDQAGLMRGGNVLPLQLEAFDRQRTMDWEGLVAQILDQGFDQRQVDDAWKVFIPLKELQRQSIIDQDQAARVSSRNTLLDQLEAANGTANTEAGALAAFERQAQVRRLAAAKDGVTDAVLLEQTLAEQRLAIQRSYAQQAAAVEEQRQQESLSRELQALQSMQSQANQLSGFLDQMVVSGVGVSPQNGFLAAQSQFGAALEASRSSGDVSGAIAAGQTLLTANSAYNATGAEAAAVQNWVRQSLTSLGATLDLPGFSQNWEAGMARYMVPNTDALTANTREVAALREEFRDLRLRAYA